MPRIIPRFSTISVTMPWSCVSCKFDVPVDTYKFCPMCASSHPARQGDLPTRPLGAESISNPTFSSPAAPPPPSRPTAISATAQFSPPSGPPPASPYLRSPQSPPAGGHEQLAGQMSNLLVNPTPAGPNAFFDAGYQPTPLFETFFEAYFAAVDKAIFPHNTNHWEPVKINAAHEGDAAVEALEALYDKVPAEYIKAEVIARTTGPVSLAFG